MAQNVVLAKLSLQKEVPLYQIIDAPTLPLKASYSRTSRYVIAGFFLSAIVALAFLLISFLIRENKTKDKLAPM